MSQKKNSPITETGTRHIDNNYHDDGISVSFAEVWTAIAGKKERGFSLMDKQGCEGMKMDI